MEKVALAAQAKTNICSRCFAKVQETDQVCPECGAPLKTDGSVHAVDSAVHAELAQANLYRLRGEKDLAEKQCLSILKRFPNEPEAHSLLGELSADKGDTSRAIEWYELALDLNPNSTKDKARLDELKAQVQSAETAQIEDQLSLNEKSNTGLWIGVGFFVLVLICIIGYASMKKAPARTVGAVQGGSVVAPRETDTGTTGENLATNSPADRGATSGDNSAATPNNDNAAASASGALSMDDRTLMQILQQRSTAGPALSSVEQDPRNNAITLTFQVGNPEDARRTGATLARDALTQSPESLLVTVRGISGDHLVFVADATRPNLNKLESQNPSGFSAGNDAWISGFLQREWPEAASSTPNPAITNPAPTTTGTTGATPADTTAGTTPTTTPPTH